MKLKGILIALVAIMLSCRSSVRAEVVNQISAPMLNAGTSSNPIAITTSSGAAPAIIAAISKDVAEGGESKAAENVNGREQAEASQLGAVGGGSNAAANPLIKVFRYAQIAKPPDYFALCLALVSFAVALLILNYSVQLQAMATKDQKDAPNASFGCGWSFLLTLVIFGVYLFYWVSRHQQEIFSDAGFDLTSAIQSPQDFAPAFFLAAIAPGILALFKFTFIIPFMQSRQTETPGATKFPFSALLGILLALVSLSANFVKLWEFFHRPP